MLNSFLDLTIKKIKHNISKSALLVLILSLSFAFSIITISFSNSVNKTNQEFRYQSFGRWQFSLMDVNPHKKEILLNNPDVTLVGESKAYGDVAAVNGYVGFGTIDDNFIKLGSIKLEDGRFPENDYEVAIESNVLSALGYSYELGQDIKIDVYFNTKQEVPLRRTKSFKLVGVLKQYAGIWTIENNSTGVKLNSIITTADTCEDMKKSFKDSILSNYELLPESTSFFFNVSDDCDIAKLKNDYAKSFVSVNNPFNPLGTNRAAFGENESVKLYYVYLGLILIITIVSIISMYIIDIDKQRKYTLSLRSLGATKKQLLKIMLEETLIFGFIAAIIGLIFGYFGTKILLKLALYSGSVEVIVSVPIVTLIILFIVWILTIALTRLLIFSLTLKRPLTGDFRQSDNTKTKTLKVQKMTLSALLIIVCATITFTTLEAFPLNGRVDTFLNEEPSYHVMGVKHPENGDEVLVDDLEIESTLNIPGIKSYLGFEELLVAVEIPGKEEIFYENMYVIDDEKWASAFKLNDENLEAFRNGDCVAVSFYKDVVSGELLDNVDFTINIMDANYQILEDEVINVGDNIKIYYIDQNKEIISEYETKVGDLIYWDETLPHYSLSGVDDSYTLVVSEKFRDKFVRSVINSDNDYRVSMFNTANSRGREYLLFADQNADYLSTDVALADYFDRNNINFVNFRAEQYVWTQLLIQEYIFLLLCGLSIFLMVFFIAISLIKLESETEIRKYRILKCIGMSNKQIKKEILLHSLKSSLLSVFVGYVIYVLYAIYKTHTNYNNDFQMLLKFLYVEGFKNYYFIIIALIEFIIIFLSMMIIKQRIFKNLELTLIEGDD